MAVLFINCNLTDLTNGRGNAGKQKSEADVLLGNMAHQITTNGAP